MPRYRRDLRTHWAPAAGGSLLRGPAERSRASNARARTREARRRRLAGVASGRQGRRPCCCAGACSPPPASSASSTTSRSQATSRPGRRSNSARAEVQQLKEERSRLEARLADSTTVSALSREARRMSLVRPGERLFIVKGVEQWRRAQASTPGLLSGGMDDRALVERQLGRRPRAFLRVVARCPFGAPAVTEQAPYDDAGDPFPTTYYLTCPQLVAAISRLEAAGGVERWSEERRARPGAGGRPRARRHEEQRRSERRSRRAGSAATREHRSTSASAVARTAAAQVPSRTRGLRARQPGYVLGERVLAEVDPLWPPQRCCTGLLSDRGVQ